MKQCDCAAHGPYECACGAWDDVGNTAEEQRDAKIARLRSELRQARELIHRYRTETPLGYQPHMIAETADHWLIANAQVDDSEGSKAE